MAKYLVSFTCDTPICIHDYRFAGDSKEPKIFRNEFIYADQQIIVETYDNVTRYNSTIVRNGLRVDVTLHSTDIISSIERAGGYADAIVSFLVLATSSYAPVVKFDFAYEVTLGIGKREYLRDFYVQELRPLVQRKAAPSIFSEIFDAVSQYEERTAQVSSNSEWHLRTRLQRAVAWFRKGITADDFVDEFIYYWLALEALDALIAHNKEFPRTKCAQCKLPIETCPYCGSDPKCFATTSPLYGIEQLASDIKLGKDEFRNLVKLRGKLLHAGATLRATRGPKHKPLIESISEKTPVARNLVIDGLSKVLGLPEEATQKIKEHMPLKEGQTVRSRLKAYIQDFDVGCTSEEGYPVHPIIEVSVDKPRIESLPSGKFTASGNIRLKPVNCKWARGTNPEVELWSNMPNIEHGKVLERKQ